MADLDPLRMALQRSPENVPLLLRYGNGCLEEWAFDEAHDAFSKVLSMEPGNVQAHIGTARLLLLHGETSQAIVRMESLLQQSPKEATALLLLARAHLGEGDVAAAYSCYSRARELNPNVSDPGLERDLGPLLRQTPPTSENGTPARVSAEGRGEDSYGSGYDDFNEPSFEDEYAFTAEDFTRPTENFAMVSGLEEPKRLASLSFVEPLRNPEMFQRYGRVPGGGLLLYGPPGCGKSLFARAAAGEAGVRMLTIRPHRLLDMYIGSSEKNLNHAFELARDQAPCVLFFDEVEAYAENRRDTPPTFPRCIVQQFLTELDRRQEKGDPILVIAATSAPWLIDSAFRRPGRFDRMVAVPPPDARSREAILRSLLHGKPVGEIDFPALAAATEGFSGSELRSLCDRVIDSIVLEAIETGVAIPLTTDLFPKVIREMAPASKSWTERWRKEGGDGSGLAGGM